MMATWKPINMITHTYIFERRCDIFLWVAMFFLWLDHLLDSPNDIDRAVHFDNHKPFSHIMNCRMIYHSVI